LRICAIGRGTLARQIAFRGAVESERTNGSLPSPFVPAVHIQSMLDADLAGFMKYPGFSDN
jgi:hypothetical protein